VTGKTQIHIGKEIVVHGCRLGEDIDATDPTKDRAVYLEIDEVTAKINTWRDADNVIVTIKKAHIEKYPMSYCVECLKEGKRNSKWASSRGDTYWCHEHYRLKMRREHPELRCPWCEEGYVSQGMGGSYCSNCDYTEPHIHDVPQPINVNLQMLQTEPLMFACDCTSWDTPEDHEALRKKVAEDKEKFINEAKEGQIF